ncbi:MAG: hypothetical protein IJ193_08750 [Bacilli bacterium]|nr:hypothetical protein [Bacilli bacterium]
MDKKQINMLIMISVIIVFVLTMCVFLLVLSDPITEMRAKENAIEYITNKYSFTPEVVSVKATERICSGTRRATPYVVTMKYQDHTFRVFVDNQKLYHDSVMDDYGSFYLDEYYNPTIEKFTEIAPYHITPVIKTNNIFSSQNNHNMSCSYSPGIFLGESLVFEGLKENQVSMIEKHSEGVFLSFINIDEYHFSKLKDLYQELPYSKIYIFNYKNKKAYSASLDNLYNIYDGVDEKTISNYSDTLKSIHIYSNHKTYDYVYEN